MNKCFKIPQKVRELKLRANTLNTTFLMLFQLRLDEIVCLRNLRYISVIYEVKNHEVRKFSTSPLKTLISLNKIYGVLSFVSLNTC